MLAPVSHAVSGQWMVGVVMRDLIKRAAVAAGAAMVLVGPTAAAVAGSGTVAQAADGCTGTGTVTCTYTGAGASAFTVPAGVTSLDVTAVGAAGGADTCTAVGGGTGGPGASVEDKAVPVGDFAGKELTVVVGGAGGVGSGSHLALGGAGGAGGTPGGGGAAGDPTENPSAFCEGGGGGGTRTSQALGG
jgi:hypothetical protein